MPDDQQRWQRHQFSEDDHADILSKYQSDEAATVRAKIIGAVEKGRKERSRKPRQPSAAHGELRPDEAEAVMNRVVAAACIAWNGLGYESGPTRHNISSHLKTAAKAAQRFAQALEKCGDSERAAFGLDSDLDKVAAVNERLLWLQHAINAPDRFEAPQRKAITDAIVVLCETWWDFTGRQPARNFDAEAREPSGAFLEFVRASLHPILPDKYKTGGGRKNLDHPVRVALSRWR